MRISQWVNCLFSNHEKLSFYPQNQHESWARGCSRETLGARDRWIPGVHWPTSLSKASRSRFSGETLSGRHKGECDRQQLKSVYHFLICMQRTKVHIHTQNYILKENNYHKMEKWYEIPQGRGTEGVFPAYFCIFPIKKVHWWVFFLFCFCYCCLFVVFVFWALNTEGHYL